jgi:hypothetical protein
MSADHVKLVAGDVERAARFMALFAGLERAFGQYTVPPGTKADAKGKVEGRAKTVTDRDLTLADWEAHLAGKHGLGIVPLRDDSTCMFGAIDIDVYPVDHREIYGDCKQYDLPLVLCRSKSGGVHGYVFLSEPVPALLLRRKLTEWAAAVGFPDAEVFPKQDALADGEFGNWINLPYAGGDRSLRYAYGMDGALTPDEFLDFAESKRITAAELEAITVPNACTDDTGDDTQHGSRPREYWRLMLEGVTEGCGEPLKGRDCAMASLAGKLFSDRRIPLDNIGPMLKEFNRELCLRRSLRPTSDGSTTASRRVSRRSLIGWRKLRWSQSRSTSRI